MADNQFEEICDRYREMWKANEDKPYAERVKALNEFRSQQNN